MSSRATARGDLGKHSSALATHYNSLQVQISTTSTILSTVTAFKEISIPEDYPFDPNLLLAARLERCERVLKLLRQSLHALKQKLDAARNDIDVAREGYRKIDKENRDDEAIMIGDAEGMGVGWWAEGIERMAIWVENVGSWMRRIERVFEDDEEESYWEVVKRVGASKSIDGCTELERWFAVAEKLWQF